MKTVIPDVPTSLRVFFIVHFAIDIVFAIPLFLFPTDFLEYFGWALVDPVASRIAAAALFGIGVESLIGSRASNESFVSLLNLKIAWSLAAGVGILISIAEMSWDAPALLWVMLVIFSVFNVVWIYWRIKLT